MDGSLTKTKRTKATRTNGSRIYFLSETWRGKAAKWGKGHGAYAWSIIGRRTSGKPVARNAGPACGYLLGSGPFGHLCMACADWCGF